MTKSSVEKDDILKGHITCSGRAGTKTLVSLTITDVFHNPVLHCTFSLRVHFTKGHIQ